MRSRTHLTRALLSVAGALSLLVPAGSAQATTATDPGISPVFVKNTTLASGVVLSQWRITNTTTAHRSTCYVLRAAIGAGAHLKVPGLVTSGRWPLIGTANTAGIFSAINGDYFDYASGAPLHPWLQGGAPMMITSDHLGVLGVGTDGVVRDADVWLEGRVTSGRKSYALAGINTPFSPARPTLYTARWGAAARPTARGAVEVVVRRNKVVAVHTAITSTPVPSDGVIIDGPRAVVGVPAIGSTLYTARAIRTNATNAAKVAVPFESAIGHGLRLISDTGTGTGKVNDWGAGDASARPRTAVGIVHNAIVHNVKVPNTLLLIACVGDDSTTGGYNGLGDNELTSFLVHSGLGVTSAVLLDGGGSTTLAARLAGQSSMSYVVTPAGNAYTRPTADAIGISVP